MPPCRVNGGLDEGGPVIGIAGHVGEDGGDGSGPADGEEGLGWRGGAVEGGGEVCNPLIVVRIGQELEAGGVH